MPEEHVDAFGLVRNVTNVVSSPVPLRGGAAQPSVKHPILERAHDE